MQTPEFYYVILIDAPRTRVWKALTTGEFTKQYWHQTEVQSDWTEGSSVEFLTMSDDGPIAGCIGTVLEADEPSLLSYTWHFPLNPNCAGEEPSRITFQLIDVAGSTKLIVRHHGFANENSTTYQMVRDGWPYVLSGLKTLCEAGSTCDFSMLDQVAGT